MVLLLKAGGGQVIVGQLRGISKQLHCVPPARSPQFHRTPGKWHFPKGAATSEICGWLMLWLFRRGPSSNAGKETLNSLWAGSQILG